MIGGRYMATKVDASASSQIKKTVNMSSLFQARLAQTPKKPEPLPETNEEKIPEKKDI